MEHIIFHIDVNSAFLSWSAKKYLAEGGDVDLREIPAIVGGDPSTRHGIVTAASIPAKAYGIHTADPIATALSLCPDLTIVPPDFAYYKAQSKALMNLLSGICPVIEQVSIDECYFSYDPIAGSFPSPLACADFIRRRVKEQLGFTVNVGISDRKVLAKMASDFTKPDRTHTLYASEIQEKMWPLPIEDLFMCGKSASALLRRLGISTIGDLAQAEPMTIESHLKSHGNLLMNYARGIDPSLVCTTREKAKGIGNSITVSRDLTKREEALPIIRKLCQSVSDRMKKQKVLGASVCLEIKYATFQSVSHQGGLLPETNDSAQLFSRASQLFDQLWDGSPIRLLGVRVTKLQDQEAPRQMNLFDYQLQLKNDQKEKKLKEALDKVNEKYGEGVLKKGL